MWVYNMQIKWLKYESCSRWDANTNNKDHTIFSLQVENKIVMVLRDVERAQRSLITDDN
jgi:hypothetical protein